MKYIPATLVNPPGRLSPLDSRRARRRRLALLHNAVVENFNKPTGLFRANLVKGKWHDPKCLCSKCDSARKVGVRG